MVKQPGAILVMSVADDIGRDGLAQAVNLRDLGGAPTRDGRRVRYGRVYRSATLTGLSSDLAAGLRGLGIRTLVDLRHNLERAAHPTPWQDMGSDDYWCRDHQFAGADLNTWLRNDQASAAAMRERMLEVYRALPYSQVEAHRYIFGALLEGRTPLLFHCAAGKDRTGAAAALVLAALRVEENAIVADYLASADFDLMANRVFRRRKPTPPERVAAMAPLFATERAYLDAMFEGIAAREGGVDAYLRGTLGLDETQLAALRDRLLEE
jgi:protein-tyrosine phosphatase